MPSRESGDNVVEEIVARLRGVQLYWDQADKIRDALNIADRLGDRDAES